MESKATTSSANEPSFDLDNAIKICSREQIQIPGLIQPHGVLLCVSKGSLIIHQCSANVEQLLGIPLDVVLGTGQTNPTTLSGLLGLDQDGVDSLANSNLVEFEMKGANNQQNKFIAFSSIAPTPSNTAFQWFEETKPNVRLLLIEIELQDTDVNRLLQRYVHHQKIIQKVSKRLGLAKDVQEACQVAAEEVRAATGFSRTMVYEFDKSWHGNILVEVTAPDIPHLYKGLRFPAADIPPQARALYTENPFRLISDCGYVPCPIVPTLNPLTGAPLDLSFATFRSVSPVHVQYLKNINTRASMSISILVNDVKRHKKQLFGLIVCHHSAAKFLPFDTRETCHIIGQIASSRIENLLHNKLEEKRIAMKEMINSISTNHYPPVQQLDADFATSSNPLAETYFPKSPTTSNKWPFQTLYPTAHPLSPLTLEGVGNEAKHVKDILHLFGADYGIIVVQGSHRFLGPALATELVFLSLFEQYITKHRPTKIFFTTSIRNTIPEVIPLAPGHQTSGALYIPLALDASSYLTLFRYEQITQVKWAGAPQKTANINPITKQPTLVPRTSFLMWVEEVRGRSQEWSELELETAQSLFVNLMELMRLIHLRAQMVEETMMRVKIERDKNLAEASSKMKSHFLANLSHEVRTPLNAILGMVDLTVATTPLDATQASYLAAVQHASESLLVIINDILDISKIESGKMLIMNDVFELGKLLSLTITPYRLFFGQKNIKFFFEIEPEISGKVVTDSIRLCQIMTNLLSNAQKYTSEGSVEVKAYTVHEFTDLSLRKEPKLDPMKLAKKSDEIIVHFSVCDTGIGIPSEKRELVFEPFEQVDSTLTRKAGGTGLGLAICRSIVNLMDGQLWCESEVGVGSHFHFEIPLIVGDLSVTKTLSGTDFTVPVIVTIPTFPVTPTKLITPILRTRKAAFDATVPKILVVEDNLLNQKVIVKSLARMNLDCDVAVNGEVAVEMYKFQSARYALVLMDICMPIMDGLVASRQIRDFESINRMTAIPIIALSAQVMDQDRDACAMAGMNAFLEKPVRFANLQKLLAPIFSQYPAYNTAI